MKLLIVDDEKLTREGILKVFLWKNWGFTTLLWQMTASTALRSP